MFSRNAAVVYKKRRRGGALLAILRLKNITKSYARNQGILSKSTERFKAVDGVDLEIAKGKTLGLVGESGCGKSTLAKIVLKLLPLDSGEIFYQDKDITKFSERDFRILRKDIQIVFQDPYSSLSPRLRIKDIVAEPLEVFGDKAKGIKDTVIELLRDVGLNEGHLNRLPFQLSGGERQRVGIARALATKPKLVVLDEPVSSLDLSTQAQIINLLMDLQGKMGLTFLFIAHNLNVVRHISDDVAVMFRGKIVEKGKCEEIYRNPSHPYTKLLLSSMPSLRKNK